MALQATDSGRGGVVTMHPEVNSDPTFLACTLAVQAVFMRLWPCLDADGLLPVAKGVTLTENVARRLQIGLTEAEEAVAQLVARELVVVDGRALSVPRFRARQQAGAMAVAVRWSPATPPSPRHDPATPPEVAPNHPAQEAADRRFKHPLLPGESRIDRAARLARDRNKKHRSSADAVACNGIRNGNASETPDGVASRNNGVTSGVLPDQNNNNNNSSSERTKNSSKVLVVNQTREIAGDATPSRDAIGNAIVIESKETVASPARRHADSILDEISRGSGSRFDVSCSVDRKRALVVVDTELARASYPATRWEIFGAYLVAGGFSHRTGARPGSLPDIAFFMRPITVQRDGVSVRDIDTDFIMGAVRMAWNWDRDGRPRVGAPVVAGRLKPSGEVKRNDPAPVASGTPGPVGVPIKATVMTGPDLLKPRIG